MPPRLLLASTNPAKQARLRWLVEGLPFEIVTPRDLGGLNAVEEDGATFAQNAAKKAAAWSRQVGCLALASDGGLVIPGLPGWEPLRTSRFAGAEATDRHRIEALLAAMHGLSGTQREAWFSEVLVLADGGNLVERWEVESLHGSIATTYDPATHEEGAWGFDVWYLPQFGRVHAALSAEERRRLGDHWSQLRSLVQEYFRAGDG